MKVFNVGAQPIGTNSVEWADAVVTVAAERAGLSTYNLRKDGSGVRFQLRLRARREDGKLRYQRVSGSMWNKGKDGRPRRVAAVCWHGHKRFFDELFKIAPEAKVRTRVANYDGREDYESSYADTEFQRHPWRGIMVEASGPCTCHLYYPEIDE